MIVRERLAQLDTIRLDVGSHKTFDEGHDAMEVVSWLAGGGFTDASGVLGVFTTSVNDQWDDASRQLLVPLLPRMVGTGQDGKDETRSYLALDWLVRVYTPAWLDLVGVDADGLRSLSRIVDLVSAEAAGTVVHAARRDAASGAAGVPSGSIAWVAARAAAGAAAGDAARAATRTATRTGDAPMAAVWDASGAAAWAAARVATSAVAGNAAGAAAARAALQPTVELLQQSALGLLDRMIDPSSPPTI